MTHARLLSLTATEKTRLRLVLLGGHGACRDALSEVLREAGFSVIVAENAGDLAALTGLVSSGPVSSGVDFAIPLCDAAGFPDEDMLVPFLLERAGIPSLGPRPIIRGVSADRHMMKRLARAHGVETGDWAVFRRGNPVAMPGFAPSGRLVVKPNAGRAKPAPFIAGDWIAARERIDWLHAQGHDALLESWLPGTDMAVPVAGAVDPWIFPPMLCPDDLRGRGGATPAGEAPVPLHDAEVRLAVTQRVRLLISELWPFDHGAFTFRHDPVTGALCFMEADLGASLQSGAVLSRSAALLGIGHAALVETILTHSLLRQGVLSRPAAEMAA